MAPKTKRGAWRGDRFAALWPKHFKNRATLAGLLDVTEQTVINWERKPEGPRAKHLAALLRELASRTGWNYERLVGELLEE